MNTDKKPFLMWFGYSRRERRSTFILLIILLMIIAFRFVLPEKQDDFEDLTGILDSADRGKPGFGKIVNDSSSRFHFDPNSASFDTLTASGFSEKQASTIMSYRKKGGKFRQISDIKKIYGIDEATAASIIPYINIVGDSGKNKTDNVNTKVQGKKYKKVDLNKADSTTLDKLPGLGRILSARIIKYRKLLGGFISVEQLKEVYGLSESTYFLLKERVYVDSSQVPGININDTSFKKLSKHPYLGKYDFLSILKYKELKGKITTIDELINNKVLPESTARKISPYLKF